MNVEGSTVSGDQEGDKPAHVEADIGSLHTSGLDSQTPSGTAKVPDPINLEEISTDVDAYKSQECSSLSTRVGEAKSESTQDHTASPSPFTPDSGALLSSKPKQENEMIKPAGKPTACFVPDADSNSAVKDEVTSESGKPVTAMHDGKAECTAEDAGKDENKDCLSDDEPLVKYISKPIPSGVTVGGSSVWTPVKVCKNALY